MSSIIKWLRPLAIVIKEKKRYNVEKLYVNNIVEEITPYRINSRIGEDRRLKIARKTNETWERGFF
jgi:hypothetical protein